MAGLPNRPPFSGRKGREYAAGSPFLHPHAPTKQKTSRSFVKGLSTLLDRVSVSRGILVVLLGLAVWIASGYVLGKVSPEFEVTVQPFEISPEIGNRSTLSGKGASDFVVDILNDAENHASEFQITEYFRYDITGTQPVSLHQAIKLEVPGETSYGIELKGVSIDKIFQLYDRARYQQWTIGGDILSSPEGLIGRIRLNQGDTARYWETAPSTHASPSELVQDATRMMLTSVAPELLGQAYLQQARYGEAAKVFRQWETDDPRNWRPTYYLSLVYGYQNREQEASNLASWSKNIADHEKNASNNNRLQTYGSEKELAANLARIARAGLEMKDTFDSEKTADTANFATSRTFQDRLTTLQLAELKVDDVYKTNPTNVDYLIQRARFLDKEAHLESELEPNSPKANQWAKQAIATFDEAIQRVPENGGLHEQRGILLNDLAAIMKKEGKDPGDIRRMENEEVKEYTRALELRPSETSPLWAAVYTQMSLGNGEEAVDLARTISLLEPSTAASTAYIVALERAIKAPGKEPKREREVEDRIEEVLQSMDENQLQTVWRALEKNNHRKGLDLVGAEGRRRFPKNSTFGESKPEGTVAVPLSALSH